ncbi:hypothetical protein FD723_17895 [Nostoc sp. C052]|uniref:hypothetical protein n=1 Tax=Nostoc sp. C052 TaxID=2576902 RepID=UPI0015C37A06|nr:hypothetical protein [Nostoc sp. C052]QLE42106.1 hypothetical protein FD723_17895 [Nostoc sp. C052]
MSTSAGNSLSIGLDDFEIRRRESNYRGWTLIQAGKSFESDEFFQQYDLSPNLPRGGIIGAAQLNNCYLDPRKEFWIYEFDNPIKFKKLYPIAGKQATLCKAANKQEQLIFASCWQEISKIMDNSAIKMRAK